MSANTAPSRTSSALRTRLPQSPRVTSSRRGSHAPIRSQTVEPLAGAPTRSAIHLTPEVVIAPRGNLSIAAANRSFADALDARGVDFRRTRI